MNLNINNSTAWSELGDKRLTRRLLQISNQLLNWQNISLSQSCDVEGSQIEGSYRFIRNERFTASQIASGGYDVTGCLAQTVPLLLAIEDSTSLSYTHSVREELGFTVNNKLSKKEDILFIQPCLWMLKKKKHWA